MDMVLSEAGQADCLASDLRRHDAEEIQRDQELEEIHQTAIGLLDTECNPTNGANIAEMLSEKFAAEGCAELGAKLADLLLIDRGPVATMIKGMSKQYWSAMADDMAQAKFQRNNFPAPRPRRLKIPGARAFLDLM